MPTEIITNSESLMALADTIRGKMDNGDSIIPTWNDYINELENKAYINDVQGIIEVTYPENSVCTCTNGTITLTAPNTNGKVNFGVGFDEWTVNISDNENTKNRIIIINQKKQVKKIKIDYIPDNINDVSWETISMIAQAGLGDEYWDIGDCKEITLNGTIGAGLILDNVTLCVFILDFNHPIDKTIADNNIIFGGFKTALIGGVDVCLCDSGYGNYYAGSTKYFNMNHWGSTSSSPYNTNYGGWAACDLRYDILGATEKQPSVYGSQKTTSVIGYNATQVAIDSPMTNTLIAALPNDMRNALSLWTRWVDNKGNSSNVDANVTAIIDAGISLLTEYEISGSRTIANTYEQNHQKQMQYYTAGNSKVKYKHNATSTTVVWWVSSAYYGGAFSFPAVDAGGNITGYSSMLSWGLAPAFKV